MKKAEELAHDLVTLLGRETVDKFIEDENGDLATVQTYSLYLVAEELVKKGWRKPATVHAHWVERFEGTYLQRRIYCSNCHLKSGIGGSEKNQRKSFCPNCGAKMDGKENEE